MMKIIEYKIVSGVYEKLTLTQEVNKALKKGWQLYGDPFITSPAESFSQPVYQAMVRYEEPKGLIKPAIGTIKPKGKVYTSDGKLSKVTEVG